MSSRSLNEATLIGNLVRDPELKHTPQNTAIVSFSIATNRSWKDSQGQQKEEVTYHRVIAWDKLAEICSKFLFKGTKVFIKGRISNRQYQDQQGVTKFVSEVVANDMIILTNKSQNQQSQTQTQNNDQEELPEPPLDMKSKEDVNPDDIPF